MKTVLIINKDQMGHGDRDLGRKVLGTFLRKAISMDELTAIALFNSGVKLASQDSPVLTELTLLHENGVDVLPCGTCVEHFGIE
ncbi:MAG: sulfurtransferase-like selenium metabolism protein YedF, partial [Planctomycetota bacterium]|nr:sulfurtransferase-like selenium metabolism protein YedF [Planctomycetota bacterium]